MLESPLMQQMLLERETSTRHKEILANLVDRFREVPEEVVARIRLVVQSENLDKLRRLSWSCDSLDAFRAGLS